MYLKTHQHSTWAKEDLGMQHLLNDTCCNLSVQVLTVLKLKLFHLIKVMEYLQYLAIHVYNYKLNFFSMHFIIILYLIYMKIYLDNIYIIIKTAIQCLETASKQNSRVDSKNY